MAIFIFLACGMESLKDAEFECGASPYLVLGSQLKDSLVIKIKVSKIIKDPIQELDVALAGRMINRLNKDFNKHGYYFYLAKVETFLNERFYKEGISSYEDHVDKYQENGYLNVFFYENSHSGFSAAARNIPSIAFATKEGYADTSTASHEMGHCLGLFHTHTQGGDGYKKGDFICGTPYADLFNEEPFGYLGYVSSDCRYTGPLGNLPQEAHDKNIRNLMSYGLAKCRNELVKDQIDKIRFTIVNSLNHQNAVK